MGDIWWQPRRISSRYVCRSTACDPITQTARMAGINVENITLSKTVTLKGMNGLKNGVVIESFDLPENDPSGGIHLTLNTSITNVSSIQLHYVARA